MLVTERRARQGVGAGDCQAHDDRVAVMYLSKIVEIAPRQEIFTAPGHPLQEGLTRGVADPDSNPMLSFPKASIQSDITAANAALLNGRFGPDLLRFGPGVAQVVIEELTLVGNEAHFPP